MADYEEKRANLRAVLERAQVHLSTALGRVESMQPFEMAEMRGVTAPVAAFFDANGICAGGGGAPGDQALFDANGIC